MNERDSEKQEKHGNEKLKTKACMLIIQAL